MKPLQLTMQAFGSYGKQTRISFEEPDQNLFLITGDTGAGKTTIFDAIVFALYGEASSATNKKDGAELQSQFAELSMEPFVELEFSEGAGLGAAIYTVRRVPRHRRPMKRKDGVKEESESVSLIMPDGSEYPQKETDKKLEEIVGLTKEQFMQVAMIAQGEFMELLRARSDDKKVIFRKLFGTELFQNITDELGRRKKEKEKEIARIRTVCQTEVSHIFVPADYERVKVLEALKRKITGESRLVVTDMEQLSEELALLCGWLKERRDHAGEDYQKASKLRDEKRDAFNSACHLQKFFDQLETAGEELAQCKKKEGEIKENIRLIKGLQAAYEIEAEFRRYDDAARLAEGTRVQLIAHKERLPELQKQAEEKEREETEAKKLLDVALEDFNIISERVSKALSLFDRIEKAGAEALTKEKAVKWAEAEAKKAQKQLAELEDQEASCRKQAEELSGAENLLALWKMKNEEAEDLAREAADMERLGEELEQQRRKAQKAREDYFSVSEEYESRNRQYEAARRAFLDAQAGFLARELRPGKACPVCGSEEHPNPCRQQAGQETLSREAMETLAGEVDDLRKKQVNLAARSESDTSLLAEKEKTMNETFGKLCGHLKRNIPDLPEDLMPNQTKAIVARWRQSIKQEGKQIQEKVSLLSKIQEQLSQIAGKMGGMKAAVDGAKEKAAAAAAALEGSRAVLESLQKDRDYQKPEDAQAARQAAREKKEKETAAYQRAKKAAQEAGGAKEQTKILIQKYAQELPVQEEQRQKRKQAYEEMMGKKAMEEAKWQELTEKYRKEEGDRLQAEVDTYNEKRASAEKMYVAAREAIGEQKRPEVETAKKEMEVAEEKRRQAEEVLEGYKAEYKTNFEVYTNLAPRMEEREKIVEEHTRLDTLYRMVSGNVSGARMDLETYVQRCYLERILHGANRRFQEMSAGQFELRMYELEKAGEGRNRGLDLMVYSSVTGKEREIRTLSGGESFMAALSLALGMADQIQETSASINLDIMFIDEGFGSLDEHSRNQAVKVLQNMAEGSRLIGIISHVTELKQEIEDQLIVSKDEKGSHVRWQIS